jgi:putative addiction module component (TIGR02574 family)
MTLLSSEEISRLSPPERLALISQLWDSIDPRDVPVSPAQEAELRRRVTSLNEDRARGVSWAELKAELERRCP